MTTVRQKDFRDLPNSAGRINPDSAVLKYGDTTVHFGMNWNGGDRDLNLGQGKDHYTEKNRKLFQSFVDAAGKKHHCPDISVPRRQPRVGHSCRYGACVFLVFRPSCEQPGP
ncbi:hypothetical protein ACFXP3_28260 [Streptomyces sp. NPDC059096]|uniref:hypothetical protein n=1 Tax=Streptomyces sp. NPDC059096 TaxID=3346727 RepID=UPI0036B5169D